MINGYPRVKFQLNKDLDKKMCVEFLESEKAGVDFGLGIVSLYPELGQVRGEALSAKQHLVDNFVDVFYREHFLELKEAKESLSRVWKGKEYKFYQAVDEIFNSHPWPEGGYVCYLSIFNCNPRFLEEKTFQVFYKHINRACALIAHEMLHFIFYDYIASRFPSSLEKENADTVWEVSEIFNSLVFTFPAFQEMLGKVEDLTYPEHEALLSEYKKLWRKSKNIDEFLEKVLNDALKALSAE
ncbi:hypothetical protein KKB83_04325 [Patescibacteria group bacterium]|nr:hypothetical protein [Patescibacteria group bacterium]